MSGILEQCSDALNRGAERLLTVISMTMALVILLQVFCRYALNHSLFWSEELGRMLLVWLTFIGASVAYKRGAHVGVSVFVDRLSSRKAYLAACCVHIAGAVLFSVMVWHGFGFFRMLAPQMTVSLGCSRQWPFLAVPLSGAVMLVHAAAFFLRDAKTLTCKGRP